MAASVPLTALEKFEAERNGFTPEQIAEYQRERDRAANRIAQNTITHFLRPRPPITHETAKNYNPHSWWKR